MGQHERLDTFLVFCCKYICVSRLSILVIEAVYCFSVATLPLSFIQLLIQRSVTFLARIRIPELSYGKNMACIKSLALLVLSLGLATLSSAAVSGSGTTTRYWDCCKGSCAWSGKAAVSAPVKTCNIRDQPLSDVNAQSGCNGGSAFMCSSQSPWAVSDTLAYGFAAVHIPGGSESSWCCACYEYVTSWFPCGENNMLIRPPGSPSPQLTSPARR